MHKKAIVILALVAFTCTSLLGQKYVISLVHVDMGSSHGFHEHIYQTWTEIEEARNQVNVSTESGGYEYRDGYVDGEEFEIYSFKSLNELPASNLLFAIELPIVQFNPVKSIMPSDVNWLFDVVARIERPPEYQVS